MNFTIHIMKEDDILKFGIEYNNDSYIIQTDQLNLVNNFDITPDEICLQLSKYIYENIISNKKRLAEKSIEE